jgi:hypothetical protein
MVIKENCDLVQNSEDLLGLTIEEKVGREKPEKLL